MVKTRKNHGFLQIFPQSNDWIIGISGNQTWQNNPRKKRRFKSRENHR
jgi:hypothetical protein